MLVSQIKHFHVESDSTYGAPRIHDDLKDGGIIVSKRRVARLMAENDIQGLTGREHSIKTTLRRHKKFKRYSKAIPGEQVQMDTTKIANGLYQFTAVDDCSRCRVLRVYKRATAKNSLDFIDCVVEEMPFPIQRVQTDRGREFFAVKVQEKFMECGIKFRPNKSASPHLNGKVERLQRTDKEEFYATIDLSDFEKVEELALWQHHYNWFSPHGSLKGKTPIEVLSERSDKTPLSQEVSDNYEPEAERIQEANYQIDLHLRELQDRIPNPRN